MADTFREPEITPSAPITPRINPEMDPLLRERVEGILEPLDVDPDRPANTENMREQDAQVAKELAELREGLVEAGQVSRLQALNQFIDKLKKKPAPLKPPTSLRQELDKNLFIRSFDPDKLPTKVATVMSSVGSLALTGMTIGSFINGGLAETLPQLPTTLLGVGITASFLIMQRVARKLKDQHIRQHVIRSITH